jgi:putative ABC transport system ATP-binding protein
MSTEVIRIENLHKSYQTSAGAFPVLKDVSLLIESGEFVAIMGPSGSGKSTFMNILGCLDAPSAGSYVLDGRHVAQMDKDELALLRNRTIGFVFQGFNLLPRMSLQDNVALPLIYSGVGKEERRQRAREMLVKVGLEKYYDSMPNKISGGQQQRVAIARALINRPRLLLADEPTGNLDQTTGKEVMNLLEKLVEQNVALILVTHDPALGGRAHRQIHMVDGQIVSEAGRST